MASASHTATRPKLIFNHCQLYCWGSDWMIMTTASLTIHTQSLWRQNKVGFVFPTLLNPFRRPQEPQASLWPEPEAPESHCLPTKNKNNDDGKNEERSDRRSLEKSPLSIQTKKNWEQHTLSGQVFVCLMSLYLLWCRTVCRQRSSVPSCLLLNSDTPPPVCSAPAAAAELWPAASSEPDLRRSRYESANPPAPLKNSDAIQSFVQRRMHIQELDINVKLQQQRVKLLMFDGGRCCVLENISNNNVFWNCNVSSK